MQNEDMNMAQPPAENTKAPANPDQHKRSKLAAAAFGFALAGIFLWIITGPRTVFMPTPANLVLWIVTGPPAILLGFISLFIIKKSKGTITGKKSAIAGIILPIMLFFILIVLAFTLPSIFSHRRPGYIAASKVHLRHLGINIQFYADDNENELPTAEKWCDLLISYDDIPKKVFLCPQDNKTWAYAMNEHIVHSKLEDLSPDTVILFEAQTGKNGIAGPEMIDLERNNNRGINVLFADGTVEFVRSENIQQLKFEP